MSDLAGRKVFKVFNQEFVVDERYNVTKELGQGAYGIVWYAPPHHRTHAYVCVCACASFPASCSPPPQCGHQQPNRRRRRYQKGHQRLQQEDSGQARSARDQAAAALQRQVPAGLVTTLANTFQATATYPPRTLSSMPLAETTADNMSLRHGHSTPGQLQRVLPLRGYGLCRHKRSAMLMGCRTHGMRPGSHH